MSRAVIYAWFVPYCMELHIQLGLSVVFKWCLCFIYQLIIFYARKHGERNARRNIHIWIEIIHSYERSRYINIICIHAHDK